MLYILRHGQTDLNGAHVLQGRSDHPLNERGREQAREVGRRLTDRGISFSRVYASPLQRAVQTARLVAPQVPITIDDRLIEMDYGPYEGADLTHLAPELVTFFSDFVHNPAPAGMEQLGAVVARAGAFVESLRDVDVDADVLVSTHAIAMKGILEYLTPTSHGAYWSKNVGNCAVYAAERCGDGFAPPFELEA